jgi:hypothetical protein
MKPILIHVRQPQPRPLSLEHATEDELLDLARRERGLADAARNRGDAALAASHDEAADAVFQLLEMRQRQERRAAAARIHNAPWIRSIMDGARGESVLDS